VSAGPVYYYVYYRVASAHADAARRALARVLERVERSTGISGHWLSRSDEPLLWMEVYEAVRDTAAFEAILAEAVAGSGLAECLAPGAARRTERFVAATSGKIGG
jgi:predicted metallo-beta-lactamase superfamily hydrolase